MGAETAMSMGDTAPDIKVLPAPNDAAGAALREFNLLFLFGS
jgi:hypothetical protein